MTVVNDNTYLTSLSSVYIPRRDGGGHFYVPPQDFRKDLKKTTARSATVFGIPVHTSFPHMLWKFQTQVTRSRQVSSPQKTFECSS